MLKKTFYWDKFYKNFNLKKPSDFAIFIAKRKNTGNLIDIGCGNGRDSIFFQNDKTNVLGIDTCKYIIDKNIQLTKQNKKIKFKNIDISSKKFLKIEKFNNVYCRFVLHIINSEKEDLLLNNIKKITKKNSLIFFEFRTTNDKLYKIGKKISKYERYTDHYRRFINVNDFLKKIIQLNVFSLLYLNEDTNFSKIYKENPTLCRIILKKI